MDWSHKGGQGNRGPWGQGPSGPKSGGGGNRNNGNGKRPPNTPDIDDFIRKGQDRFRQTFSGGGGGNKKAVVLLILAAVVLWMAEGIYRVNEDEIGVVLRFGEYHRLSEPGLRYRWPRPIESEYKPKVTRVNRAEVGFRSVSGARGARQQFLPEESLMLTGDENIVDINFEVQWKIRDAADFLFNVRNPEIAVKNAAESAVREVIGRTPIATALAEGRLEVELASRQLLQDILDSYQSGIEIVRLQMLKVDPPSETIVGGSGTTRTVIDAFRDVQTARADMERSINEAESYRNEIIPIARGDAEKRILEAQAYRDRVIAQSEGEAARFLSVYNEYINARSVTRQRLYLETMEEILRGMDKVLIDPDVEGVMPFLPLPEMQRRAANSQSDQ